MIRTACLASALLLLALAVAAAQVEPPPVENDDSRFGFHRAEEGYLRLDGRTGQVSVCTRRPVGWTCQLVPDERAALEAEIARLQTENAALKRDLLSNHLPLPSGVKPDLPPATVDVPPVQRPRLPDFKEVMTFVTMVWHRLVDMIVALQRDLMRKS